MLPERGVKPGGGIGGSLITECGETVDIRLPTEHTLCSPPSMLQASSTLRSRSRWIMCSRLVSLDELVRPSIYLCNGYRR